MGEAHAVLLGTNCISQTLSLNLLPRSPARSPSSLHLRWETEAQGFGEQISACRGRRGRCGGP